MKKTFKATAAFLLILAVAIGMCACSGGAGGKAPGKKIAIVTATLSQNPEEYQRAAQLASEYSYVEHVVYTDTRVGTSGILDFYKRVNRYRLRCELRRDSYRESESRSRRGSQSGKGKEPR